MVDVGYKIKKSKFKYAGHVIREGGEENRWAKRLMEWQTYEGRRRKGRPKMRWSDELMKRLGTTWYKETY